MAITRTQIARQLYRYGGDTMGGPNDKSNQGPTGGGETNRERGIRESYQEAARRGALKNLVDRQQDEKIEEKLEKFRDFGSTQRKFTNFLSKFSPIAKLTTKFGPLDNRDFFLDKVLGSKNYSDLTREQFANLTDNEKQEKFDDYMSGRMSGAKDAYGNPIGSDGDGQQFILPQMMPQAPSIVAPKPEEEKLEGLRLAFRAEGGIIDEETGRQMYGLGKLVKKATRAVKKVAKSPIGKAALLYAGTAGLGALGAGKLGTGFKFFGPQSFLAPSNVISNLGVFGTKLFANPTIAQMKTKGLEKGFFPSLLDKIPGGGVTAAIGASSLLPLLGLGTGDESEEEAQAIIDQSGLDIDAIRANPNQFLARRFKAEGGSMKEPVAKKTMPLLDMGGQEMDLRAEGGFVPIGRMEKADDVPARLSKNEFVFTADAVRNAGDGNVDKGAEVMYNMMKNLEAGGEVSEESQGLEGARRMFQTSQRLEEVL
mgnify:CR=1 FL=1